MGEVKLSENRAKGSKFADQNQIPKSNTAKGSNIPLKPRSSWGSNIVKGFSGDKKTKVQTLAQSKKVPLSDNSNQKNVLVSSQVRVKRSLIGDLSCSVTPTQVHPQFNKTTSSGSRDLYLELDHLRGWLQESKEREIHLQAELLDCKRSPKILNLERELELKKIENDNLLRKVAHLESENTTLSEQLVSATSTLEERQEHISKRENTDFLKAAPSNSLEVEVLELRRINMELQLEKRNLACRLSSMESKLAALAEVSESDIIEKIKAEAFSLRHTNEDLSKQVENLQVSRLNEVEELVYLRWVNSCLRSELRGLSSESSDQMSTPISVERNSEIVNLSSCQSNTDYECRSTKRLNLVKKLKRWPITDEDLQNFENPTNLLEHSWSDIQSPRRRHSISGAKYYAEDSAQNKRRQSDGFMCLKEVEKEEESLAPQIYEMEDIQSAQFFMNCQEINKARASFDVERRVLRIPNPPPRPSCSVSNEPKDVSSQLPPPPPPLPPPPPPPKFAGKSTTGMVKRAPQVVEFYHSLMKRDSKKESSNGVVCDTVNVANVRSSMIGEIENRSSHLIAIKADVETQGEFVNFLIKEVNEAVFQDIEDVVAFVKWLDDELCFLVDERAVLKHFDWPEKKADTLREAAFGYRDLKKLEYEVSNYNDDTRVPCDLALKKMVTLSEKMERTAYSLLRTRDSLMRYCKDFQIPTDWMVDSGILSKIKFGSVKLAKKYMKRVATELHTKGTSEKDSSMDYMLLQGVRFAFRIHQFAGGFDAETMHAFEELRNLALVLNKT
ncbi:protein CHUP1, chloroplastic-like [Apium graveolens]|uniref:protein CHUP1, chloroplastic-like n=1 Tax=Apium graveolens TaxID=4045 RepID=UPI003D7A9FA9